MKHMAIRVIVVMLFGAVAMAQEASKQPKIRIGITISHYTATGDTWVGRLYGYRHAEIASQFRSDNYELVPILDPHSQIDADVQNVLGKYFPGSAPIFADDPDALKRLDVIVMHRMTHIMVEELANIVAAARNGTGIFIQTQLGMCSPGCNNPLVLELHGQSDASLFWISAKDGLQDCVVVSASPLLPLEVKDPIRIERFDGLIGTLHGTPLISCAQEREEFGRHSEAPQNAPATKPYLSPATLPTKFPTTQEFDAMNMAQIASGAGLQAKPAIFCPLYTTQVGKGRVVVFQSSSIKIPVKMDRTPDGKRFYDRCVEWLVQPREGPKDKRRDGEL